MFIYKGNKKHAAKAWTACVVHALDKTKEGIPSQWTSSESKGGGDHGAVWYEDSDFREGIGDFGDGIGGQEGIGDGTDGESRRGMEAGDHCQHWYTW